MESNQHEESISSDPEDDLASLQDNSFGVGRSYECVFCKLGFNTAQALGGHMNIHRKDRARNKPASVNSSKHEDSYSAQPFYQQIPTSSSHCVASHEAVQFNHRTYFPASTSSRDSKSRYRSRCRQPLFHIGVAGSLNSASSARPFYANHHGLYDHSQHRFNPFGDNSHLGLTLPCGPALVDDIGKNRRVGTPEEELDLELRLGSKKDLNMHNNL